MQPIVYFVSLFLTLGCVSKSAHPNRQQASESSVIKFLSCPDDHQKQIIAAKN